MRFVWISVATAVVVTGAVLSVSVVHAVPRRASLSPASFNSSNPAFFNTVKPGKKLPSGAQCARWVRSRPMKENKRVNRGYNRRTGQRISRHFFHGDTWQANKLIAPRVNGDFTGTTAEILRWAACKWGINQNIVFAQAAVESWWRQSTEGDWSSNGCPPGHDPGVDGRPGLCPQTWGILQNRYPYEMSAYPGSMQSTAMNADLAYGMRSEERRVGKECRSRWSPYH